MTRLLRVIGEMPCTRRAQPLPRGDHAAVSIPTTVPINLEECGYAGFWGQLSGRFQKQGGQV